MEKKTSSLLTLATIMGILGASAQETVADLDTLGSVFRGQFERAEKKFRRPFWRWQNGKCIRGVRDTVTGVTL